MLRRVSWLEFSWNKNWSMYLRIASKRVEEGQKGDKKEVEEGGREKEKKGKTSDGVQRVFVLEFHVFKGSVTRCLHHVQLVHEPK